MEANFALDYPMILPSGDDHITTQGIETYVPRADFLISIILHRRRPMKLIYTHQNWFLFITPTFLQERRSHVKYSTRFCGDSLTK